MATYVLVHGAWHTGAELEPTAAPIRAAGHVVHTPTIAGNRPGDAKTAGLAEAIKSIFGPNSDLSFPFSVGASQKEEGRPKPARAHWRRVENVCLHRWHQL